MKKGAFLTYLALSTLAIGQPVLDLYGRNVTVFSVAKFDTVSTVVFVAILILAPAFAAWTVDRFSTSFGPTVHAAARMVLVRVFLALFLLALLNTWKVRLDVVAYPLALVGAWLIGRALERSAIVSTFFTWLKILPVIVVGLFVVQAQPVLMPPSGKPAKATIEHADIPVFQVVFDELPLFSLLGSDGNINAERFPGFATLQREGTWYRDSAAVSNFTHQAVPAILTSSVPSKSSTPLLWSHPRNVFTLLGGVMPVDGIEPVTSLCPTSLCANAESERSSFSIRRMRSFLHDAAIVYGRRIAPDATANSLPRIDMGWGGFDFVVARRKSMGSSSQFAQQDNIVKAARNLANAPVPMYQLVHALAPHAPWYSTPDKRVYVSAKGNGYVNSPVVDKVRDGYQKYLYQLVATDAALLEAINTLKKAGVWDKALVIVTADHGISFVPGVPQRFRVFTNDDAIDEEFRVPTFIKYPQQRDGEVSDCPVSNLDLLPTIVDVLGVKSEWTFSGTSIRGACPSRDSRNIEVVDGDKRVLADGFEHTLARMKYHATLVPVDGPVWVIPAVGASADLIGTRIGALPASSLKVRWTLDDAELFDNVSIAPGSVAPYVAQGGIILKQKLPVGTEGIIVLDDIAAGVVGELALGNDFFVYESVLDYRLLTAGKHSVRLVLRDPATGALTDAGPRAQ